MAARTSSKRDKQRASNELEEGRGRSAGPRFSAIASPIRQILASPQQLQNAIPQRDRDPIASPAWKALKKAAQNLDLDLDLESEKPVNVGSPEAVKKDFQEKGKGVTEGSGWKTAPFIFGGEIGERTGSFGLQMNLINFLLAKMNMPLVAAVNTVTDFFAITCLTTLGGAVLADVYLGRFRTIALSCLVYFVGLLVFTMTATMPGFRPAACNIFQAPCERATSAQMGVLYVSLILQCLGSGGVRPCVAPFGADQFERSNKKQEDQLRHYFNWYYLCIGFSFLASLTVTVYIQDSVGWGWGAGVCAILMATGTAFFLLGAPFYKYLPPAGSPLTSIFQVFVAASRKYKHTLPNNPDDLHEARKLLTKDELENDEELLTHTENIRLLDKAAILESSDIEPDQKRRNNPWRLCSVHQVEEAKILLRMVPVWLCAIAVATVIVQSSTFIVQQAMTMDRRIGRLTIPPASMGVFSITTLIIFIPAYDLLIIRVLRYFTGNPKGLTSLQRIGVGLVLSIAACIAAAVVEAKRKHVAQQENYSRAEQMLGVTLPISAFWLVPQYVLTGLCECFLMIGELEFFYDESPVRVRSMGNAFLWTAIGVGSFLSSALVSIIQDITQDRRGRGGWLQDDINKGHLDRFYCFLAALCCLNCIIFYYVSSWYVYKDTNLYGYESSSNDDEKAEKNIRIKGSSASM